MEELRKPKGNAPKKIPAWQVWAKVEENKTAIMNAAGDSYKNIGRRNAVAVGLFREEPEEVKAEFEAQSKAQHDVALAGYQDALSGSPSPAAEDQAM